MVFTRLFCGITEHTLSYTCAHTLSGGGGLILSAVLHYMVCMPCSTCSDLQKSGCQEYRPGVVCFEEKDFCNSSLAQKWVPLHYLSLAMQHWWLLLESLTVGLLFGAFVNLRVWQRLKNSGTFELFSQLYERPCLKFWECDSIALENNILSFNHRYNFADGCKLRLRMLSWLHSSHVSAWIDELKISLYFC